MHEAIAQPMRPIWTKTSATWATNFSTFNLSLHPKSGPTRCRALLRARWLSRFRWSRSVQAVRIGTREGNRHRSCEKSGSRHIPQLLAERVIGLYG